MSKEEQCKRFLARIDDPDKNWKLSTADVAERKFWHEYMQAYEECISATSTEEVPWYVVPANDKESARLIISQIILDSLNTLKLAYPKPGESHQKELKSIRRLLLKEQDNRK
jgi:polyphosphate kinase 2 (PPK2 family)